MRPKVIILLAAMLLGVSFCGKNPVDNEDEEDPPQGKIVFSARWPDQNATSQIYVMNPDGTDLRQLTFFQDHNAYKPRWSHDGTQIAFLSDSLFVNEAGYAVYVMNTDGGNVRLVTDIYNLEYYNTADRIPAYYLSWSPVGAQIALARSDAAGRYTIWVVDLVDSSLYRLTPMSGTPQFAGPGQNFQPSWSPDGSQIAFVSNRDFEWGDNSTEIYLMNADGSDQRRLTFRNRQTHSPAWSPNGNQLAYYSYYYDSTLKKVSERGTFIYDFKSEETDSLELEQLPGGQELGAPYCWSPDGKWLLIKAFWKDMEPGPDRGLLYALHLVSGELKLILDKSVSSADWARN